MNLKKFISTVSAAAIAVSAFVGIAISASAESRELLTEDFEDDSTIFGTEGIYDTNGTGARIQTKLLAPRRAVTATFDEAYEPAWDKAITVSYQVYCGYYGSQTTETVTFKTPFGDELASYDYNVTSGEITSVKLGGKEVEGFTAFNFQNRADENHNASGFSDCNDDYKSTVTLAITISTVSLTFLRDNPYTYCFNAYTGELPFRPALGSMTVDPPFATPQDRVPGIDNIVISEVDNSTYTVKYCLEEGQEIKSETYVGVSGTAPFVYKNPFDVEDKRYFYVSDNAEGQTISPDNGTEVHVTVREADKYTVSAKTSTGEELAGETTVVEGDMFTYNYPKYLTDQDKKITHVCDDSTYSITVIPDSSQEYIVNYSDYTDGTAYFYEGESFAGSQNGLSSPQYSGGSGIREIDKNPITITAPEAGKYTVTLAVAGSMDSAKSFVHAYKNSTDSEALDVDAQWGDRRFPIIVTFDVELDTSDSIIIKADNDEVGADYILLKKTAELDVDSTHAEVFEFDTANVKSGMNVFLTVKRKSDSAMSKKAKIGTVATEITGDGYAGFAINVKDISDDYEVNTITIE